MAGLETSTNKIVSRLKREGWILVHGGAHDKYTHADRPGTVIVMPRHATLSPGVARSIAKSAGWNNKS